ncbi:MAG: flagellar brake protein [Nitrosomonas sp.]|nr:flagellar brake protein [Nitrosomonas sp.]MCW5606934.1 flagellar brake protein [Nitrosomonas sp.]
MVEAIGLSHLTCLTPEEIEKFRIHRKIDMLYILRKIMQKNMLITLYFDKSNHFILTSILDINDKTDELLIDSGHDQKLNQLALASMDLTFITSLDRVKIEFTSNRIRETLFEDQYAFTVKLPDSLIRIQRRNHFRIPTPIITPIKCVVPLPNQEVPVKAEITLIDISCGGIGVIDHHPVVSFEPGMIYDNCQINLPEIGCIISAIQVKNTHEMTLKNGKTCKRAGCQFINLSLEMETMIQRYITLKEQASITP